MEQIEKIFKIRENHTTVKTEIIAGLTTFMTMAYIIALNPNLLTGFGAEGQNLWNGVFLATCIASFIGMMVMAFVVVLDNDKKNTINDQHDGNDHIVIKFLFNNVIKRKSDDDRRQTCYQDLKPEDPLVLITVFFYKSKDSSGYCRLFTQCHLCFLRDFSYVKRPQLVPVQYNNCQDRAKLDHHQEKFHKCLGYIQLDELIHKDHMSGTADRKPLGDSLHNTEKDNLQ